MEKKNYDAVDLAKWICAWMVMYIHFAPVFTGAPIVDTMIRHGVCRVAVPFFFASSAFFLFQKIGNSKTCGKANRKKLWSFACNLLLLYTVWSAVYIAYDIFYRHYNCLENLTVIRYIRKYFLIGSHFHLWYLIASVYGVFVVYGLWRIGRPAMMGACALGCVLQCLRMPYRWDGLYDLPFMIVLTEEYSVVYRTISMAIPLMCLGVLCWEDYRKKSNRQWFVRATCAAVLYAAEMVVVYILKGDEMEAEILLSGPLVVYYLTNWLFTVDFSLPRKWVGKSIRLNSTWIYCAHMLVAMLFHWIFAYDGIVKFCFVGGLTVLSGIPYVAVKLLKDKRKKKPQAALVG